MSSDSSCEGRDNHVTAIFIRDVEKVEYSDDLAALKLAVLESLSRLGVPVVTSDSQSIDRLAPVFDVEDELVVFCDGPQALAAAKMATRSFRKCTHVLFLVPTSFAGWGKRTDSWSRGVEAEVGDALVVTDSPFSRRVIERHLSGSRADVRVVRPSAEELHPQSSPSGAASTHDLSDAGQAVPRRGGPLRWSFEAAKSGKDPTTLVPPGVEWDFNPDRIPRATNAPIFFPETQDAHVTNDATIREVVRGKSLTGAGLRISIHGTKLTFIDELSRDLARESGSQIALDEWRHLSAPSSPDRTNELISQSDVVIGEWARPNNVWLQEHVSESKRLIVRAHRYEVTVDFPHFIDMDRFDASIVIVPWVGRELVQRFGWPSEKMVYIPNYVNTRHFARKKLPSAEFTLGMVGITPELKRVDLALDLLEDLRQEDLRYNLRIRGPLPPAHINWAKEEAQAIQWGYVLHRIEQSPLLRGSVLFDSPGRDMAAWYEQIGVILSMSDLEGSHVALAEGIASGALPVARAWPGIATLWPSEFIFGSRERAKEWILNSRDPENRAAAVDSFQSLASLDQDKVLEAWWEVVNGNVVRARSIFGPINWSADTYEPVEVNWGV